MDNKENHAPPNVFAEYMSNYLELAIDAQKHISKEERQKIKEDFEKIKGDIPSD